MYTKRDVLEYVNVEDVKFIRLAFCDVFGKQHNISVLAGELERAFESGISIDASAVTGFGDESHSDLFLRPDPATLSVLPWRPAHYRVARMFCDILNPDGSPYEKDSRKILFNAEQEALRKGIKCRFGSEFEFYLFKTDEFGNSTDIPFDSAGYMDIAPADKGENIRREICLHMESMGIIPECSHHEEGPGQNEIDFKYAAPLISADNAVTFRSVVETSAMRNGLCASFMPKPLKDMPGNGMHINISAEGSDPETENKFMAGVLNHIKEMTLFLNPTNESYMRLGGRKAPKYISWSRENRLQLIRIPAAEGIYKRFELRSPDPCANVYLAYALIIYAGLEGIEKNITLPAECTADLRNESEAEKFERLPLSLDEAKKLAEKSDFIGKHIPKALLDSYLNI